jgi:DNA invertase Pin-like site-specific DNA recombinase
MAKKKTAPAGERLVAYYRYSGGSRQTEQSIEGQRRDCEAYAAAHGLTICAEYIDRHISGKTDERENFQRMIADSDRHAFDAVICWKTDRISRNRYDSAIYKNRLKKNGVRIIYAAESIPDGPDGIILESLMEGLAEYYSAELSQKLKRGMRESASKCHALGGYHALGLTTNKQHEYIIDETEAPTVRWIFEQYAAGVQASQIVRALNDKGKRTSRGGAFNKMSILRIVTNQQYIGVYESHGFRKEDGIPAIVERPLWDAVQKRVTINRDSHPPLAARADYLLSGKLFCGYCQTAMKGVSGTSHTGEKHYYYNCPDHARRGCDKKNIEKEYLEGEVISKTAAYLASPGKLDYIADKMLAVQAADAQRANPEKEMLEAALKDNQRRQANIMRAIEDGGAAGLATQRLKELEKAAVQLQYDLDAAARPAVPAFTRAQIAFMLDRFKQAPDEQDAAYGRRLVDTFISSIYLTEDQALVYFNLTGKDGKPESEIIKILHQPNPPKTRIDSGFNGGSTDATSGGVHVASVEPNIDDVTVCLGGFALFFQLNSPSRR